MDINESLEYIHNLRWMSKKLGLSKTRELLNKLGNPERKLSFIHVGGTNGKGSTSAMLAEVLREEGYKTGLFTSPFIMRFNERIMVSSDNPKECNTLYGFKDIPDEDLARITSYVKVAIDEMEEPPSEFEVVTVIGLLYFLEEECDIVVLEVGMGGELDATNVIPAPIATVLVNIGLDHTQYLGSTVAEIARTKAGIIKAGSNVVFYGENSEAQYEIEAKCDETRSHLVIPDFNDIEVKKADLSGQVFSYHNIEIAMPMIGAYQRKNAAVVLETIELMRARGMQISDLSIKAGIAKTVWIARLEKIHENPLTFVDGSHNPQGMRATVDSIKSCVTLKTPDKNKIVCVFGVMADKDVDEILNILSEVADELVCVQPQYPRAMECNELFDKANTLIGGKVSNIYKGGDVPSGIDKALSVCSGNDILLCLGSLYMASEVRNYFMNI